MTTPQPAEDLPPSANQDRDAVGAGLTAVGLLHSFNATFRVQPSLSEVVSLQQEKELLQEWLNTQEDRNDASTLLLHHLAGHAAQAALGYWKDVEGATCQVRKRAGRRSDPQSVVADLSILYLNDLEQGESSKFSALVRNLRFDARVAEYVRPGTIAADTHRQTLVLSAAGLAHLMLTAAYENFHGVEAYLTEWAELMRADDALLSAGPSTPEHPDDFGTIQGT
jgi:hypothetical protein